MSNVVVEVSGNLPEQPTLIYPNRVDFPALPELERALGGRVAWLVERNCLPSTQIMAHMREVKAAGILGDWNSMSREMLAERIRDRLAAGFHVVLLMPPPPQAKGSLCDVPTRALTRLDGANLPIMPLYVGMFSNDPARAISHCAPYEQLCLRFMPLQSPGPGQGARVRGAWMEAEADSFAQHPLLQQASLPRLLVSCMLRHENARLIDGVDDSSVSCRDLLAFAIILARRLPRHTRDARLGIILPPGKLAIIANLACLLAGITPVNCDYRLPAEAFAQRMAELGIHRYLTEERFTHKLPQFTWPHQRDMLFIERELAESSGAPLTLWRALMHFGGPERVIARLRLPEPGPDAEASVFFTKGTEGRPKGIAMSQRMALAGLLQLLARLDLPPGERVLASQPLYTPAGLLHGLLLPLLAGCDIVSYPTATATRRITQLIAQNKVRLALSTPALARPLLERGKAEDFSPHLRYLIICGGSLPAPLAHHAQEQLGIHVLDSYSLTEAGPLATLNLPPQEARQQEPALPGTIMLPCFRPGSVGAPLPGVAVRITDAAKEGRLMPPGSNGMIWLKGANMLQRYLGAAENTRRGQWFRTGDIGSLDENGLLSIAGRRSRFARISGEMVPHERLEAILAKVLKLKGPERKIAIVSIPSSRLGEELVLLSTVHPTPRTSDLVTLKYGVMNEGFPSLWAPEKILPVPYIPLLPDGTLNYLLCHRHACRAYGITIGEEDQRP